MDITVSKYWQRFKDTLFPEPEIFLGNATEAHLQLMLILDTIRVGDFFNDFNSTPGRGRPTIERICFFKAFIAKAVLDIPFTTALIDRLEVDIVLRRICGFIYKNKIPCEATFSNAFKEFSDAKLAEKIHEILIKRAHEGVVVTHVSRDSTAIEAREKGEKKEKEETPAVKTETAIVESKIEEVEGAKRGRGRPKKGEIVPPKDLSILEQQRGKTLQEMIDLLPNWCNFGCKKNSQGFKLSWRGYKLHIDTGDYGIPLSCILTSASVHDSAVSLPLEEMTSQRVHSYYTLADAAYDAAIIKEDIENRGKVPVIDNNPRRGEKIEFDPPKKERYKNRSGAERTNAILKDNYGANFLMVKGASKIMNHLMFGVLAATSMQLAKLLL